MVLELLNLIDWGRRWAITKGLVCLLPGNLSDCAIVPKPVVKVLMHEDFTRRASVYTCVTRGSFVRTLRALSNQLLHGGVVDLSAQLPPRGQADDHEVRDSTSLHGETLVNIGDGCFHALPNGFGGVG